MGKCVQCGKEFPESELTTYQNQIVCVGCESVVRQSSPVQPKSPTAAMLYGGFWIRVGAKLVDSVALTIVNVMCKIVFVSLITFSDGADEAVLGAGALLFFIVSFGLSVFYHVWMLGKYEATLGKMAFGLKVVVEDGTKISYSRACGRYFAELLSGIILYIGYVMAAFDDEKRTLHDRICATRVVFK